MLGRLILIFILVPLADLILLMVMSSYTGWAVSIGLVILSGIVGAYLARRSTSAVWGKITSSLQKGQMNSDLISDGAMIFFAAGLLLTPGFLTDFVGLSLLIPVCRQWYKARLTHWFKNNFKMQVVSMGHPPQDPNTVDGEVLQRDEREVERKKAPSPELLP
ncbi:MAG: FxsA family protein [Planctomycetota bacterium]